MNQEQYWLRFGEFLLEEYPDTGSKLLSKYELSKWYIKEE